MPLTDQQIAEMDAISGLTSEKIAQMDAIANGRSPQQGDVNDNFIPRELRAAAYGVAGGQVPFGNVITSGIGAGIAKAASPFTGDTRTLGQLYDQAQADTKAVQEASPTATTIGNVAGILSTLPAAFSKPVQGGGVLTTPAKGLKGFADFTSKMAGATPFKGSGLSAWAGNTVARGLGGAAVSAPVAGLYAAGEADAGQRGDAFLKGAGTGAAFGAALPVAGSVLGAAYKGIKKSITPELSQSAMEAGKTLNNFAKKHGIDLKVSDIAGSNSYKRMIAQGEAMPLSGAEKAADKTQEQINRAATRTLGEETDKVTPEYLNKIRKTLGSKFEDFTKGKEFIINPDAYSKIDDMANVASRKGYGAEGEALFKQYQDELNALVDDRGFIKGDKLDKFRRDLSKVARRQGESDIGMLASDFENAIVDIISDSDPAIQKAITDLKYKYKNYKVLLSPAARNQATGDISPLSLSGAVQRVYGLDNFATGRAGDLGEIARVGQALRKPSSSGTAENIIAGRGLLENTLRIPQYVGNSILQNYNRNPERVQSMLSTGSKAVSKELNPSVAGEGLRVIVRKQPIINKEK